MPATLLLANASLQLLPEAAAQRRLEAVSCKALLGSGTGRDPALTWAFVPFLLCLVGVVSTSLQNHRMLTTNAQQDTHQMQDRHSQ
jgi:hypothetical protein